jgi:hypothetical protein
MTTRKISGLQAARNWMDSLGMRHYGEVDHAIAIERAATYGNDPTESPELNSGIFLDYAHSKIRNLCDMEMQFKLAFHSSLEKALNRVQIEVVSGNVVYDNAAYRVTTGNGKVNIYNKQTDENYLAWRASREQQLGNYTFDSDGTTAITLHDGTDLEIGMVPGQPRTMPVPMLTITSGDYSAELIGIHGSLGHGLHITEFCESATQTNGNTRSDVIRILTGLDPPRDSLHAALSEKTELTEDRKDSYASAESSGSGNVTFDISSGSNPQLKVVFGLTATTSRNISIQFRA